MRMRGKWNRLKMSALSERGKRMAEARWAKDRERRAAEMPERVAMLEQVAVENLPRTAGDVLGVMQWTCARSGRVRRWVVRIGDRADRITVEAPGEQPTRSHGWAWFLAMLRRKILRGG